MKKNLISAIGIAALVISMGACGNATSSNTSTKTDKNDTSQQQEKAKPADLTGTWKQTNSNSDDSYLEATVSGDTIEVDWVTGDTKSLYWKGSFEAPTEAGDWKWTSQGDTDAMSASLMGSQDKTKDFAYSEADGISWETSALGSTMTVKTAKQ